MGHPVLPHPVAPSCPAGPTSVSYSNLPGAALSGNDYPVPGFGFDYTHFFAVHPEWGKHHFVSGVVVPFAGFGGFYVPIGYYDYTQPEPAETATASNAATEPSQASDQAAAAVSEPTPSPEPRESTFAPLKAVSEYIFVKRDGTLVFAVAYSLTNGNLAYISREGLRRTIPLDSLDFEATEKSNEEHGNPVTLPRPLAPSAIS